MARKYVLASLASFFLFVILPSIGLHAQAGALVEPEDPEARVVDGGVEISKPVDGAVVESGDSITVVVEPVSPFQAQSVLLMSEFKMHEDTAPPFEFVLEIPADFIGRSNVSALGKNGVGDFADAGTIEIVVESPAELTGVSISSRDIFLNGLNDRRQIRVYGQYSDGNERDITGSRAVSFVSSNSSIVTVSDSGMVVPKGSGVGTIFARSGNFEDSISAEVLNVD